MLAKFDWRMGISQQFMPKSYIRKAIPIHLSFYIKPA